jgi:hypothetical protein
MGKYTDFMENQEWIMLDREDSVEGLMEVTAQFRGFGKALDSFLEMHGYTGNLNQAEEKKTFVSERFREAGIEIPQKLGSWFDRERPISKKNAFRIGFAFQLSVEEMDDFFRRICLERGFDCHDREEAVYFFAFLRGLSYREAEELLKDLSKERESEEEEGTEKTVRSTKGEGSTLYTRQIVESIEMLGTKEELLRYLRENEDAFSRNNVTAFSSIHRLWEEIARDGGLAERERNKLYIPFGETMDSSEQENEPQSDGKRKRLPAENSEWGIFLQILGIAGPGMYGLYKERSLKSMLRNNSILHVLAEDSFPDRNGLNKILNGEHVSDERVRKLLILLVYYRFWAELALRKNSYKGEADDSVRCNAQINDYLTEAGYPALYPGNPYDWIFLYTSLTEFPLITFREDYMRKMAYFCRKAVDDE